MKLRKTLSENKLPKIVVPNFAFALLALAVLCAPAMAQEMTAEDWSKKGQELRMNSSLDEALTALDKAITLDSGNADALAVQGLDSKGP